VAGSQDPHARRVVILGASVAWGAYASSIRTTYFTRLAERLAAAVGPVRIAVVAAGAWDSENELKAFRVRALPLEPDLALLLNGMNDVTNAAGAAAQTVGWPEVPSDGRVARYFEHMTALRDLAREQGVVVAFALQPSVLGKRRRTALEERVLELTFDKDLTRDSLEQGQRELRRQLETLCRGEGSYCLDTSSVFDQETATTFTDACTSPIPDTPCSRTRSPRSSRRSCDGYPPVARDRPRGAKGDVTCALRDATAQPPERRGAGRLDVEPVVHDGDRGQHQRDEHERAQGDIGHEALLPVEVLGLLCGAVGKEAELQVIREQPAASGVKQDQLDVIANDEDPGEERAGRCVEQHAHEKPLGVVST